MPCIDNSGPEASSPSVIACDPELGLFCKMLLTRFPWPGQGESLVLPKTVWDGIQSTAESEGAPYFPFTPEEGCFPPSRPCKWSQLCNVLLTPIIVNRTSGCLWLGETWPSLFFPPPNICIIINSNPAAQNNSPLDSTARENVIIITRGSSCSHVGE